MYRSIAPAKKQEVEKRERRKEEREKRTHKEKQTRTRKDVPKSFVRREGVSSLDGGPWLQPEMCSCLRLSKSRRSRGGHLKSRSEDAEEPQRQTKNNGTKII
jgi:hypothetical protein